MQSVSAEKVEVTTLPTENALSGVSRTLEILISEGGGFTFLDSRLSHVLDLQERFKNIQSNIELRTVLGEATYTLELEALEKAKSYFLKSEEYEVVFESQFGKQPWQQICGFANFLNMLPSQALKDKTLENCINKSFVEIWAKLQRKSEDTIFLDFDSKKLCFIPKIVFEFKKLEKLTFSNNNLTIIPAEIGQLTALKILFFNHNRIRHLPIEIQALTKLRSLYLSHNKIVTLSYEIGRLKALISLEVSYNPVANNDKEIDILKGLLPHCHRILRFFK